jgi:hypothetical protein
MDHPRSGLKYVRVEELDRSKKTLENFTVEDPAGEKLGTLEGFTVDVNSATPSYAVVNAGGWFRSKHFLIPIGHVALDDESRKLIADVPKERVKRFPGFDLDIFPKMEKADFDRMAEEIGRECCPDVVVEPEQLVSRIVVWAHYRTPAWWDSDFYRPERVDDEAKSLSDTQR